MRSPALLVALALAALVLPDLAVAAPRAVLSVSVKGPGSVSAGPAGSGALKTCRRRCRVAVRRGGRVVLVAQPAAGAALAGFKGGCAACSLRVARSRLIVARFVRPAPIRVTVTGVGKVSPSGGSIPVVGGGAAILRAAPGAGQFVSWSGCAAAAGALCVARAGAAVRAAFAASPAVAAAAQPVSLLVAINGPGQREGVFGDFFVNPFQCLAVCRYDAQLPSGGQFVLVAAPDLTRSDEDMFASAAMFEAWHGCVAIGGQVDDDANSLGESAGCYGPITSRLGGDARLGAAFRTRPEITVTVTGAGQVEERDDRPRGVQGDAVGDPPIVCSSGGPSDVCSRRVMRIGRWSYSVLSALPSKGWRFRRWGGCPAPFGPGGRRCLVPAPKRAVTRVSAVFARKGGCHIGSTSCITDVLYTGARSSITQTVDPASGACALGNWSSGDIAWRDTNVNYMRLFDGNVGRLFSSSLSGTFRFDLDCGILHQHCTGTISDSFPVTATAHGREGDWTLAVEAYDAIPAHSGCHVGPDGDFPIMNTFVGTIHLKGSATHPRPRTVSLTVTRNSRYTPQAGEVVGSSVNGRLTVSGVW